MAPILWRKAAQAVSSPKLVARSDIPGLAINPFYLMTVGIKEANSIAFAVVFALFAVLYGLRLHRRPKNAFVWRFLLLFCIFRVVAFVIRHQVGKTSPSASNFMALLIVNGVFIIAGFLFLVEGVLAMLFQYFCALRGVSGEGHKKVAMARHATVAFISVIGIVGAVLQITALNKLDMKQFDHAKKLRMASGGMFCCVSAYIAVVSVAVNFIKWSPGSRVKINKVIPSTIFCICGLAMLVESIYRVLSARSSSGWIAGEEAVDVMLVLPEWVILTLFIAVDFDSFRRVTLCNPFGTAPQDQPDPAELDDDAEFNAQLWTKYSRAERAQSLAALVRSHTNTSYEDMLERKIEPVSLPKAPRQRDPEKVAAADGIQDKFTALDRQNSLNSIRRTRTNSNYKDQLERKPEVLAAADEQSFPPVVNAINRFSPLDRQSSLNAIHRSRSTSSYKDQLERKMSHSRKSSNSSLTSVAAAAANAAVAAMNAAMAAATTVSAPLPRPGPADDRTQNTITLLDRQAWSNTLRRTPTESSYDDHRASLTVSVVTSAYMTPPTSPLGSPLGSTTPGRTPSPFVAPDPNPDVHNLFTEREKQQSMQAIKRTLSNSNYEDKLERKKSHTPPPPFAPPSIPLPRTPPRAVPTDGIQNMFSVADRQASLAAVKRTRHNSHYEDKLDRRLSLKT